MKSNERTIGIMGGMGPEATVELMRRIVAATPANDDIDHIHMIVDNNPKVPSRIKALIEKTGESPSTALIEMGHRLEKAGADGLAIACNTAHYYAADVTKSVSIPLIDMISCTAKAIAARDKKSSVGLLASPAVIELGLYHRSFLDHGLQTIIPQDQEKLLEIIKAVKRGETGKDIKDHFKKVAESTLKQGATILAIACTELSVISDAIISDLPVIDALDVLATEIIRFCKRLD